LAECKETCELCERVTSLTFHHLIPRQMHRRTSFKKRYSKEQLASGALLCRDCHRAIHKFYSEFQLGTQLNTIELLQDDEAVQRHVRFVKKRRIAPGS